MLLVLEMRSPGGAWLEFDVHRPCRSPASHATVAFKKTHPTRAIDRDTLGGRG
jgi:hypothetical protein